MTLAAKIANARARHAFFRRVSRIAHKRHEHFHRRHTNAPLGSRTRKRAGRLLKAWNKRLKWSHKHELLWEARLRHLREERTNALPTRMYDDVTLSLVPPDARAVGAYINGLYANVREARQRFPHAKIVTISITASEDADALDIENGDATISEAPAWVRRQHARGKKFPILYTSASNVDELVRVLDAAGISRSSYIIWSAHYTFSPHVCGPNTCGACRTQCEGTQFTDVALGRSLDESMLLAAFWR